MIERAPPRSQVVEPLVLPSMDCKMQTRYRKGMAQLNTDVLIGIAERLTDGKCLTPAERAEVLRIAQGFACKDSAAAASVSPETIRARRKRIYRKLGMPGAGEMLSSMLALSLDAIAQATRTAAATVTPPEASASGIR